MGLNIKATRRMSLAEFAEGWDDCYLTVSVIDGKEAESIQDRIDELRKQKDERGLTDLISETCNRVVQGGVVINTDEKDGSQTEYRFSKDEVQEVVEAIGDAWRIEAFNTATGTDRLKSMKN